MSHIASSFVSHRSTYPQGDISIIPQLLTLMAAFSTLMAFPVFNWEDGVVNFMCVEVEQNKVTRHVCTPLILNTEIYWQDDDAEGWAGAIRTAALFGIFAAGGGFMAFALLSTATCFVLTPRRLLSVLIVQGVCAVLTIFTLVAGAADVCKHLELGSGCENERSRIDTGAGFMICAFFLYIAAGIMTFFYFIKVRSDHTPIPKEETKMLIQSAAPISSSADVSPSLKPTAPPGKQLAVETLEV
jgi:hypothetical protein